MTIPCKDCRHFSDLMCMNPKCVNTITDFINGKEITRNPSCCIARTIGECKREALLFEPRQTGEQSQ